ncbi:DUF4411 family protein [Actinokineospora sp.]|uniref:DUF4411 family protein n=1 Tax=Actinokineospora sp. TaxID=1872133 RepID=UPI003D6BDF64
MDSNIFIEAKNRYYGFDYCPAFWSWIEQANAAGTVLSVAKVRDELLAVQDELSDWAKAKDDAFFRPTDSPATKSMSVLAKWAVTNGYSQASQAEFLDAADYYLVAYAHAHKHIVVTNELPANGKRSRSQMLALD